MGIQTLSHHARILHGWRLHGGPSKTAELTKLGVGACARMRVSAGVGTCPGQYGGPDIDCLKWLEKAFQSGHIAQDMKRTTTGYLSL